MNIFDYFYCMFLYTLNLGRIALNVLGNWRFASPNKENAKRFSGTKKCGGMRRGSL